MLHVRMHVCMYYFDHIIAIVSTSLPKEPLFPPKSPFYFLNTLVILSLSHPIIVITGSNHNSSFLLSSLHILMY